MYILNADESVKLEIQPDDSSRQTIGVQEDDVLSLSFIHFRCVPIDINDCVFFDGKDYRAMERYLPEQLSETKWRYDIKLYGPTSLIKRYLVSDNGNVVFPLTGTPADHLQLIIDNINRGIGYNWLRIGNVEPTELVSIEYNCMYANEALAALTEKTNTEWWIDSGGKVNLAKCSYGDEITLRYGEELVSLEKVNNNNQKFFTRLYPIGSTKNIDTENYGYERLQLPETDGERPTYIESSDINDYGIIEHAEETLFEDIYPIYIGEVDYVSQAQVLNPPKVETIVRDAHVPFNVADYIEPGATTLKISFLTGDLKGLGPDDDGFDVPVTSVDVQEHGVIDFEIQTYDAGEGNIIPNATIKPKRGDLYIFKNIGIPDIIVKIAEGRLREKAKWLINEARKDTSTYKGTTNHVLWKDQNLPHLHIGRKVKLFSNQFFHDTEGMFSSRITRISRHVNIPEIADIEISESLSSSVFQSLAKKVDMIYESYAEQHKEEKEPSDLTLEWTEEMGPIPNYATKIDITADNTQTILLPDYPIDRCVIVIENKSNVQQIISGNTHDIVKNGTDDPSESIALPKTTRRKFIFYNEFPRLPQLENRWFCMYDS